MSYLSTVRRAVSIRPASSQMNAYGEGGVFSRVHDGVPKHNVL